MKVLVIENDVMSAEVVAVRLSLRGCEVAIAHSPEAAMARAHALRPDLVLAESWLEDGGEPTALFAALRSAFPEAPIVLHSIYAMQPGDAPNLDRLVQGYLPKPFRLEQLHALVDAVRPARTVC